MTINPDDIKLEFFGEPLGDRSFRTGYWSFTYKGEQWEFYASIPHEMSVSDQYDHLKHEAAQAIETGAAKRK